MGSPPTAARGAASAGESDVRLERLTGQREFDALFREGCRVAGPLFTLVAEVERGAPLRVGFSVPRAVGGAVQRNRARRRLREALRRREGPEGLGGKMVLLARKRVLAARPGEVEAALGRALAELARRAPPAPSP